MKVKAAVAACLSFGAVLFVAVLGVPGGDAAPLRGNAPGSNLAVVRAGIAPSSNVTTGGTLVIGSVIEPQSLNPNLRVDDGSFRAAALLYQPLVVADLVYKSGKVYPALAESWKISRDGLTYTFNLAQGAKWHDGVPVTAADVVWTFSQIIAKKGGSLTYLEGVRRIRAIGTKTVRVVLAAPNSAFLTNLGLPQSPYILPKHLYRGTDWTTNPRNIAPVGSGPFKFESWQRGSLLRVVANKDFYLGRPALDTIIVRFQTLSTLLTAFEAGEYRYTYELFPFSELKRLDQDSKYNIQLYFPSLVIWAGFNLQSPPFNDVRVRRAFAHAVNRDEINQRVYAGLSPANLGLMPKGWAYDQATKFSYNPTRARELLDSAGYKPDSSGNRMSVTLSYAAVQGQDDVATVLKGQLKNIGVDLRLESMDFPTYTQKVTQRHDFQMATGGGYAGPDPDAFRVFVGSDGFRNIMSYKNRRVDSLFYQATTTVEQAARKALYRQLQRQLLTDVPRFNIVDYGYHQPTWSCLKMPFFTARLAGAKNNIYQGFLYAWLDRNC